MVDRNYNSFFKLKNRSVNYLAFQWMSSFENETQFQINLMFWIKRKVKTFKQIEQLANYLYNEFDDKCWSRKLNEFWRVFYFDDFYEKEIKK